MTTIDRDRDRLRRLADAATPGPWEAFGTVIAAITGTGGCGGCSGILSPAHEPSCYWSEIAGAGEADAEFIAASREAVPELLDALTRAEAQSETRRQQTKYWKERAEEFEAERDEWRQTALDERGATLDLLEQIKVRDRRIQAVQHLVDQADHAGNWTVTCTHLQQAIDGTNPHPYRASETA